MRSRSPLLAVLTGVATIVLVACGGDAEEPAASTAPPTDGAVDVADPGSSTTAPATPTTLDQSPFCVAVRALDALGSDADEPTPEQVLEQTEAFLDVLAEAQVNAPEDAPPAVEALIDDWRSIAEAIEATGGDADAAYERLRTEDPDLYARLGDPAAHREAFEFFADRCGVPIS